MKVLDTNLTDADLFSTNGCLRLPGFHSRARLAGIRQKVLDEIKRVTATPGVAQSLGRLPVFQQIGRLSGLVKVRGLHEALMTAPLSDLIAQLAGRKSSVVQETQLLLSPARQGAWTLEALNWHVDVKPGRDRQVPGIQAFFLLDDVAPQGGATLALAGSHREELRRPDAASALRETLRTAGDLERRLRAMGISPVEMSGRAGDVFLMDMRVLHTPSVNATRQVRMMATCRCLMG